MFAGVPYVVTLVMLSVHPIHHVMVDAYHFVIIQLSRDVIKSKHSFYIHVIMPFNLFNHERVKLAGN